MRFIECTRKDKSAVPNVYRVNTVRSKDFQISRTILQRETAEVSYLGSTIGLNVSPFAYNSHTIIHSLYPLRVLREGVLLYSFDQTRVYRLGKYMVLSPVHGRYSAGTRTLCALCAFVPRTAIRLVAKHFGSV